MADRRKYYTNHYGNLSGAAAALVQLPDGTQMHLARLKKMLEIKAALERGESLRSISLKLKKSASSIARGLQILSAQPPEFLAQFAEEENDAKP